MRRGRFTEDQIIGVLREHEAGVKTADLCRKHGISDATFYNWKSKYGGLRHAEILGVLGVSEVDAGDNSVAGPAALLERIERLIAETAGQGDMTEVADELRTLALACIQSISALGHIPLAVFAAPLSRFEEDRVEDLLAMDLSAVISTIHAKAAAYRQLRASVDAPDLLQTAQRDPVLMARRQRMSDHLTAGELDAASAELASIVDRVRELGGRRAAEQDALRMFEISLVEEQARLEGLKGNNIGAAERFMSAAQLIPIGGEEHRVRLLSLSLEL